MRIVLLALALLLQTDPRKVLVDPAKRANDKDRKEALEHFRSNASGNTLNWGAAKFLEEYGKDTVSPAINVFLERYWKSDTLSQEEHAAALKELAGMPRPERGSDPRMLLALPHLSALGEAGADQAQLLGMRKVDGRWAYGEGLALNGLVKAFSGRGGDRPPEKNLTAGRFSVRYVAMLLQINDSLEGKGGCESTYKKLSSFKGSGSVGAHLKALLESYEKVARCQDCEMGRRTCHKCGGTRFVENQDCPICRGAGKVAVIKGGGREMGLKTKCKACAGKGKFDRTKCAPCEGSGKVSCGVCAGKYWSDICRDCFLGKQKCSACQGLRQVVTPCPACGGRGKTPVKSQMRKLGYKDPCKKCKTTGKLRTACESCSRKGIVTCRSCKGSQKLGISLASPSKVYATRNCDDCRGSGFPFPNVAAPCLKCYGLGVMIAPAADPSKVIK
jgi:hypothetical protein